jgi:hypothetical protein
MNKNIDVHVRISISAHYLKRSEAPEILRGRADFNTPRLRFARKITRRVEHDDGNIMFNVILDEFKSGSDGWKIDEVATDYRRTSDGNYFFSSSKFNMPNKLSTFSTDYFLHFLSVDFTKDVAIPNTNNHARSINRNWADLTLNIFLGLPC